MTETAPGDYGDVHPALAGFPERWEAQVAPRLEAMEDRRLKAVRSGKTGMWISGAIALIAFVACIVWWDFWVGVFLAVCILFAGSFIAWAPYNKLSKEVKAIILPPAVEAAGMTHTEKDFTPDRLGDAERLKLVRRFDRSSFEDRLEGAPGGRHFVLYEAKLEQKRKSEKSTTWVTVFRGIIGVLDFPSSALGTTVLARDGGWFDGMTGPAGMERAPLVDAGFEKIFTAWTTDQVEARYFLTPTVMQALLDLEDRFSGSKIRGAFTPGSMIFALETGNWFEAGSLHTPLADPSRARRLLEELGGVLHLLDTLRECAPRKGPAGPV